MNGAPYTNINRVGRRCNQIDVHELLKQQMQRQMSNDNDGAPVPQLINDNLAAATRPTASVTSAPSAAQNGFEDYELYFDSTARNSGSDLAAGEMVWSIGLLNNSQDIKNCVQITISPFYFPKIYAAGTNKPEYLFYRKMMMELTNISSSQAITGPGNNKFHYEFDVDNLTSQAVSLRPVKNTYYFQRPIISISEFATRFTVPVGFKKVPIPRDTVAVMSLLNGGVGYNPIRFQIMGGDTTAVLGPAGALGLPGVAVVISGFISNDDAVNSAVNSAEGVYATTIISPTVFEIDGIDASTVSAQFAAQMYIPKNRIAFSVRFTCLRNNPTNYITPVHN